MSLARAQASFDAWRVAAGAACISFAPVFVKLAAAEGMEPSTIAAWRMLVAFLVLVTISALRGGRGLFETRRVRAGLLAGSIFFVDLFVWHRSILLIGAGPATILGNTQVFWTIALGRLAFGEWRIDY